MIHSTVRRSILHFGALLALCAGLILAAGPGHAGTSTAARTQVVLPLCKALGSVKDLLSGQSAGLSTVEQGYRCLLRHYISNKHLDHRILLNGGYNALRDALKKELPGRFDDLSPLALTGDPTGDWQAFAAAYAALGARLPALPSIVQALAEISLDGMARSLHDDHTGYVEAQLLKQAANQLFDEGASPTLGIVTSPITTTITTLYITDVFPNSPASEAGLHPGDVIQQVGGSPALSGGALTAGSIPLVLPTAGKPLTITVLRPATGAQLTVTVTPRTMLVPDTTARVLQGNIAYVKLYNFTTHAYARVLSSIRGLGLGAAQRGLVLDLRGNGGGVVDQAVRLLSAFVHHATVGYSVDGTGHRDAATTDDRVPLLHQPLVVLIDGGSASSSELVAGAVRDLHLGQLVGETTAGDINGSVFYGLSDGSGLQITEDRVLGAVGEAIDKIGIAPDVRAPARAADLSAGHDPAIDRAVSLLASS